MFVRLAALFGLTGVILGALGAHGSVHDLVVENGRLANWQTAVFYQLVHAVAMLALAANAPRQRWPIYLWTGGILLFSGSLYVLSLTNITWLGAITPFGGTLLMVGWAWLIFAPAPKPNPA